MVNPGAGHSSPLDNWIRCRSWVATGAAGTHCRGANRQDYRGSGSRRQARSQGCSHRVVATRYVAMPLDQARRRARDMRDRIRSGENLPLVCKLLGHKRHWTTAGDAHLSDAPLVDAAEKVGNILAREMLSTNQRAHV